MISNGETIMHTTSTDRFLAAAMTHVSLSGAASSIDPGLQLVSDQ